MYKYYTTPHKNKKDEDNWYVQQTNDGEIYWLNLLNNYLHSFYYKVFCSTMICLKHHPKRSVRQGRSQDFSTGGGGQIKGAKRPSGGSVGDCWKFVY